MTRFVFLLAFLFCVLNESDAQVRSHFSGSITVSTQIDSVADYSNIEVLVATQEGEVLDTLGYAVTDVDGRFATDIEARDRGIFPLLIMRNGNVLNASQYVVADGDSATIRAQLPLGDRSPIIRSPENSAWGAFKNTEAQHNQNLLELLQAGQNDAASVSRAVELASSLLWSLQTTFPNTFGGELAATKSVVMLDGWNDSLLVARAEALPATAPGIVEVIRAGRHALSRTDGLDASLAWVRAYEPQLETSEQKAALRSELVQAHLDSLNQELAVQEAQALIDDYPESSWVPWAQSAIYEAENLMPGMEAPALEIATSDSTTFSLADVAGRFAVIEFWSPRNRRYDTQLPQIEQILLRHIDDPLTWVFVAFELNDEVLETWYEGRDTYGIQLRASASDVEALSTAFNIATLPTRVLIDPEGRIIGKYAGDILLPLDSRLADVLPSTQQVPETNEG